MDTLAEQESLRLDSGGRTSIVQLSPTIKISMHFWPMSSMLDGKHGSIPGQPQRLQFPLQQG